MTGATPAQAAANAFVTGCVKRGLSAAQACVPPEGQLATVRGLWADVAQAAADAATEGSLRACGYTLADIGRFLEAEIAAQEPKPAPGLEAAYLYHWRFDRGEEFGLYWRKADADAMAARRAGDEGFAGVLGMAILGEHGEPEPAPELAAAMARVRRALEGSPTAAIARREALEIINALGLPS